MEVFNKSQTVDPEVRAYVYSLVNAVGGQSTLDDRYSIGDDALAVLNDLLRWLRLYDDKTNRYDVKRCLAEANLVTGDLLEILALWPEEAQDNRWKSKLALACLQIMVTLTWPMEVAEEKTTMNHMRHRPYIQLAQVGYKRGILHCEDAKILRTAVRIGLRSMAEARRERSRRDEGIIKLMLYFFRNLAMITQPQELPSQGDENEISRSATIEAFHEQDVFNLLLTVGSAANDEFQEHDVIVLETLFHLLKGVDAKKLFMEKEQVANEEINELQSLMQKEKVMLNSYNKHAPTRHNRFGTMLWVKRDDERLSTVTGQNSITNASTTLMQMDATKKYNKPKYRGKLSNEFNETSDFGMRTDLTESARKHLRTFIEDFLDSSFNPLFASLRKAIERETDRIVPSNHKQFWFLISWFLTAEAARRDQKRAKSAWHADRPSQVNPEDNTFAYIAAVLDQETFVLLNRHMQRAFDDKSWQDLQANLLCFTQILLTVQSMAESTDEEDLEIAENIQNRIFYEESTHDRIVAICRGYTHQGFAYLDAVTECVHVFVRMLERYSKQNADLQIRSKRRARKKQKRKEQSHPSDDTQQDTTAADDRENAAEDEREAHLTASERKFDFARFSAKFLSQNCVNTFISLLHFYGDLSPAQLKRCHRFFYRLAFKHELAVMLFRVDILMLFQRIVKGPNGLDTSVEGFKEWEMLVQQVFRRCIKWVERQGRQEGEGWKEAAVVEMLFSKIPSTLFYLQNGFERVVEKRTPRPPAELEIKASVTEEGKRVGVAVSVMLELGNVEGLEWVKKQLKSAVDERQVWEDESAARAAAEASAEEATTIAAPTIFITPANDERKSQLFKDKHLRLLLTTLGLQRLGTPEDTEASWIVPSELSAQELKDTLEQIQKAEFEPPTFDDGKNAQDLVRNKSAGAARRGATTFSDSESSAAGSGDEDEAAFPPNPREKLTADPAQKKKKRLTRRNRTELTEEQVKDRADERRKREKERNSKVKSQLYITASDDESDEERDAEFFRREEETRNKMSGIIKHQLRKEAAGGASGDGGEKKGTKRKAGKSDENGGSKKMKKATKLFSDDEEENEQASDRSRSPISFSTEMGVDVDSDEDSSEDSTTADNEQPPPAPDEEETPSTSPTVFDQDLPLAEVAANTVNAWKSSPAVEALPIEDEDEDDAPVRKPAAAQRRNVRTGFIIDDDSDEE
ncbi:Topoisomerase 1-associated factor 1 [Vermiconidia calcicola]|uniref:Topoisomerase 1-associated factor 1 n=1 Tax=Vermiconidia calcicola TaxID=1690605 RepID=A0ACC3MQ27_9PEZI|nr:Topoisomerase 1-associated factor 1 [Vermiconidia calcicola]